MLDLLELTPTTDDGLLDSGISLADREGGRSPYAGTYALPIRGWALGLTGPLTIEARHGVDVVQRTLTSLPSPEVAGRYADLPSAASCAFQLVIGTLELPLDFQLDIVAVGQDGSESSVGRVRGRRQPLDIKTAAGDPQPLLITTLGRSGSEWLRLLLSKHPDIVAYRPLQSETRLGDYWIGVLTGLAAPQSYMQALFCQNYDQYWWIGDERPGPLPLVVADEVAPQWLGREHVHALAEFCRDRISAFYRDLAEREGRTSSRYFAEKVAPNAKSHLLQELYPDARELVLVRDLRDMVCSITDYNARRGFELWGRKEVTDREWLELLRDQSVRMLKSWKAGAALVRYEDLITDQLGTLGTIFSWLGLAHDPALLSEIAAKAKETLPMAQGIHRTSSSVEQSIGRWKLDLDVEWQIACSATFDDVLEEWGYEPTITFLR